MRFRMMAATSAAILLASLAEAAPKTVAPLADKLPAGALAYAGWAGRSLTFDGSMLGQLLNDPDVDKIVQAIVEAAERNTDAESRPTARAGMAMAAIAWQHPAAAALLDVPQGPDGPEPSAVLLVDLGKDREAFAKHLDALLAERKGEAPPAGAAVAAVRYRVIRQAGKPELSFGYMGDLFFLGVGSEAARAVIEKAPKVPLSADKKFSDCLAAVCEGEAQFAYYLDVSGLVGRLERLAPPSAGNAATAGQDDSAAAIRRLASAAGLDKVTAAAGATVIVDRGLYTRARVFTPAPHRGVLWPLAGAEVADADLAGVAADADFVLAAKVAPQAALAELRQAVRRADPNADDEFGRSLARLEARLGVSLSKDVLAHLGDGWVLSSAASRGGFLTGTTLTVDVKDPAKLAEAIARIEAAVMPDKPVGPPAPATAPAGPEEPARPSKGPAIETIKFARTEVHYLALPSDYSPMPIAPAWAIHKNRLVVAAWPQVIESAVAGNGPAKGIAQTPAFRSARGRIAGKPSVILYVNGPAIARQVYHAGLVGWTLSANKLAAGILPDARPDWLPPLSTIEQYLRPSIVAVCPDAGGITIESYGSLPSIAPAAGLLLNPAVIWLAAPEAPRMRSIQDEF